jgi:hypothetical protein
MEYLYYLRNFNAFHIFLAASIKHMGIVKTDAPEAFVIHTAACSLLIINKFQSLKILFNRLSGAVADSFKTGN